MNTGSRRTNHKRAGFEQARRGPPKEEGESTSRGASTRGPRKWGEPRQALRGTAGGPACQWRAGPPVPVSGAVPASCRRGRDAPWRSSISRVLTITGSTTRAACPCRSEFRRVLDAMDSKDALYIVPQLDDPARPRGLHDRGLFPPDRPPQPARPSTQPSAPSSAWR